jgi:hypothetical protein
MRIAFLFEVRPCNGLAGLTDTSSAPFVRSHRMSGHSPINSLHRCYLPMPAYQ